MKLVKGEDLTPEQVEQVKAIFVYRYTVDNPRNNQPAIATGATQTDEEWIKEHAFYVRNDGQLGVRQWFAHLALEVHDEDNAQYSREEKRSSEAWFDYNNGG